jgi:hypothetical protein
LARDTQEYIDMTPYFQGRVGDSLAYVPVALLSYGKPFDLTGYDIVAMGQDPAGNAKRAWQTADTNGPGDSWRAGKATFRFPAGFFTVPGEWENFCFKVISAGTRDPDNAQVIVSTLNLKLTVYDNAVYMQSAIPGYDTYADSLVEAFEKYIKVKMEQVDNLPQTLKATIDASKTLSDVVDQYLDLFDKKGIPTMATLNAMISAAQSAAATDATTKVNNAIAGLTKSASDFNVATMSATDYIMSPNSSNGPNNLAGVVSVHGNSTRLYQLFVDSNNDAWTRARTSTVWTSWNHVTMFY